MATIGGLISEYIRYSYAITGNLNFINILANINHIQIIMVSTPLFSWTKNILIPYSDRHMFITWFLCKLFPPLPEIWIDWEVPETGWERPKTGWDGPQTGLRALRLVGRATRLVVRDLRLVGSALSRAGKAIRLAVSALRLTGRARRLVLRALRIHWA